MEEENEYITLNIDGAFPGLMEQFTRAMESMRASMVELNDAISRLDMQATIEINLTVPATCLMDFDE